jgi:hypothetical protein
MKVIAEGQIAELGIGYEVKVEDAKLKIAAVADFDKLVDAAAEKIPGNSPMEILVLSMIKQGLKAI